MISIMYDRPEFSDALKIVINKLAGDDCKLIVVPSFDFELAPLGIHFSPAFMSIIRTLTPRKRLGVKKTFSNICRKLKFMEHSFTDFDMALALSLTLWIKNGGNLVEYYKRVLDSMHISRDIYPLLDPPPHTEIEDRKGLLYPKPKKRRNNGNGSIKDVRFIGIEKTRIIPQVEEILAESKHVILLQLTPLSIKLIGKLKEIHDLIHSANGTIIYLLPQKLTPLEERLLDFWGYSPSLEGLIEMTHKNVDVVLFDSKNTALIDSVPKYDISMYPISYSLDTSSGVQSFLEELDRIIK